MGKGLNKLKNMPVTAKASIAYVICNIVQKCLSFITMPLFTRLLTKEQYGMYSLYLSWSAIITVFTTLNLPSGTLMSSLAKYKEDGDKYIGVVQLVCLILSALLIAIYLPLRGYINDFLGLDTFLVVLMVIEILANAAILCWSQRERFAFRYKAVVLVTLIVAVAAPALSLLLVLNSENKGYARILGVAAVTIIVGAVIFMVNQVRGKNPFNKAMWKHALGMNLPLIIYYLSQVVFNQSDRIMIDSFLGEEIVAVYSVGQSLALLLTFVINAVNNSYVPWYYMKIREDKEEENKGISCALSIMVAFLLLGIIWLAPEIVYVLGGPEYREAIWIVPPIAMSVLLLFYVQFFVNVEFYYEKKYFLVFASIGAALINIALNYLFIPKFGFVAAGYTTLVSYIVFALSNYIAVLLLYKKQKTKNRSFNIPLLILILAVFMGLGFTALALYNYPIPRYIVIGVALLSLLIAFKPLKKLITAIIRQTKEAKETNEKSDI